MSWGLLKIRLMLFKPVPIDEKQFLVELSFCHPEKAQTCHSYGHNVLVVTDGLLLLWGCVCIELHCFKALKRFCLYLFLLKIFFKNQSAAFYPDLKPYFSRK